MDSTGILLGQVPVADLKQIRPRALLEPSKANVRIYHAVKQGGGWLLRCMIDQHVRLVPLHRCKSPYGNWEALCIRFHRKTKDHQRKTFNVLLT